MDNTRVVAYCESIDNAFLEYMTNRCNEASLCKRLSISLTKISETLEFPKKFNVILIDGKNDFCGIKVYPDGADLARVLRKMDETSSVNFCKDWMVLVREYNIEIDKNCFNKQIINFTNKELTAMLLHELAHVAYSSTIPEMIYNSYRIHREEIKFGNKTAVRIAQQIFYAIPIMIACGMHVARTGLDGRREEYIADQIFGITEYKPHLYSAIDKLVRAYGTTLFIDENNQKKTIDNLMTNANVNIKELNTRRRLIKDELLYQSANTHSKAVRRAYVDITTKLGIGYMDRHTNETIATEAVLEAVDTGRLKLNGILNDIKIVDTGTGLAALECSLGCDHPTVIRSAKLPTDYEIELVALNVDKIHSNLDKMGVLDELYDLKDKADSYSKYALQNNIYDTCKFKIDKCRSKINELIDAANFKDVTVIRQLNAIAYPEDYSN